MPRIPRFVSFGSFSVRSANPAKRLRQEYPYSHGTQASSLQQEIESHDNDHHQRRNAYLLQGLGSERRPAHHLLPRLAAQRRCLGCADGVLRQSGFPHHRPRPPQPRPLRSGLAQQYHGPVCRRPRRTDRTAGPSRRHPRRPLHRRRRSHPLYRPPRHGPRRQSRPHRRGPPADAEDRSQSGRPADRRLRRHPQGHLSTIAASSSRT
jgi:hypothetical protein